MSTTTPHRTRWLRLGKAIRAAGAQHDWDLWVTLARSEATDLHAVISGCFALPAADAPRARR